MSYIGAEPDGMGKAQRFTFTASGGETTVTADDDGIPIGYTAGQVSVYLNGVKLVVGTDKDCRATDGSTITHLAALTASDVVEVVALSIFSATTVEGTALISTGETGGSKFLREDGDGTSSWQTVPSTLAGLTDTTVSSSDPAIATNPTSGVGHFWINTTSGEAYILNDATGGANVWKNIGGGIGDVSEYVQASGGDYVSTIGDYKYHLFTASKAASNGFIVHSAGASGGSTTIEYLVVAAGGGGGGHQGGGGGAGGLRHSASQAVTVGSFAVTIEAGGVGGIVGIGTIGGNSVLALSSSITATGGGGGGAYNNNGVAGSGGSGGGAGSYTPPVSGGTAINDGGTFGTATYQGHAGGAAGSYAAAYKGAGGGGAGAVGATGGGDGTGIGGAGLSTYSTDLLIPTLSGELIGSTRWIAGGGGGGHDASAGTLPIGGNGGGGDGTRKAERREDERNAGIINTGGGGGGAGIDTETGGTGGSGLIIVKYKFQN